VLGRRTGAEQQPILRPAETGAAADAAAPPSDLVRRPARDSRHGLRGAGRRGHPAIIAADPGFDVARFLEGAQAPTG
jgi:hypothetical protein